MASVTEPARARALRNTMTNKLLADGKLFSPTVEAAFQTVPRHVFVPPGTPVEQAYDADASVITKCDESGTHLSSVSAPWLQATMMAQAGLVAGMSVLEIGSGGYNAALLAEVTGPSGQVVSMDIFSVKSSVLNF
jgi:protein-L-isoaspartate(D-aspartate) O-methyltransferase